MEDKYYPEKIEPYWQKKWEHKNVFQARMDLSKPKYYILEMLPYPSGTLHIGNMRAYTIGDVVARYKRMNGYNVLHPMGWDALGLPAENAAISDGVHPEERTRKNIKSVRAQMKRLGLSYDWEREFATCDKEYYRWCQWFFLKMYERGLVYRRKALVNWCPSCLTVLANEQVIDGKCERCKSTVIQREIPDWALRITRYANELLDGLNELKDWSDRITSMQRNWIGKSVGCELIFDVEDTRISPVRVFTTRADTVYGATYIVLAPEHKALEQLTTSAQRADVYAFRERVARMDKIVRTDANTEKNGVWTGSYAINPFTNERIPIWTADFVLADYGTGAVMSVPAHDQRDFEFAKRFNLPIRVVIQPPNQTLSVDTMLKAYIEDGVLVNSCEHTGKMSDAARTDIACVAEKNGWGKRAVSWHLVDWSISRQRYWGTPIPMIHCAKCGIVPVPYDQLPIVLPRRAPLSGTGEAPLAKVVEFVHTTCPRCGGSAKRDTDTMDTYVDSAWYFARYLDPKENTLPFRKESARYWLPIDLYVGGPEHAVRHLLYSRFWYKVMRDMGMVEDSEPIKHLLTQGMVVNHSYWCTEHGYRDPEGITNYSKAEKPRCTVCGRVLSVRLEKMSKSKHNGVSPDVLCKQYGADTLRLFCLFTAPPEKDIEFRETGIQGCYKFLCRVWAFFVQYQDRFDYIRQLECKVDESQLSPKLLSFYRLVHKTIQKVTQDIDEELQFNTAIAAMMQLLNATRVLDQLPPSNKSLSYNATQIEELKVLRFTLRSFALMLVPFAPHFAEEVWRVVGSREKLALEQTWPVFSSELIHEDVITMVVQVNGKLRSTIEIMRGASQKQVEHVCRADPKVQKCLEKKTVRRIIVVPDRVVNIVVS